MTARQRVTKHMRLRRRREFVAVSEAVAAGRGRKVSTRHFTALLVDAPAREPTRVGVTVTKKVGHAPTRNRIRRLVREHLRTTGWLAPGFDVVLVAKLGAAALHRLADVAGELTGLQRTITAHAATIAAARGAPC